VKKNIYKEVAKLHIKSMEQGFMPTLGESFLSLLYESIDADPNSVLIIETKNEKVIGFVTGGSGMGSIYRQMLIRWFRLTCTLVPNLLNPLKLKKILEIVFNTSKTKTEFINCKNELFSISVSKEYRGLAVSERLYEKLCQWFVGNGVNSFKIVVGESLIRANGFYRKMGAKPADKIIIHEGELSTLYFHDLKNHQLS